MSGARLLAFKMHWLLENHEGTQLAKDIEQANQYLRTMMNKFIQTPLNGDPSAVAEAKVAVAEAKVEVAKQEVAVTEANVARARQSG
eukprot:3935775-Rhodomonas_salina.2